MLANPFKTRIIAEAQIKTDKVDARILADLLRGRLVSQRAYCRSGDPADQEVLLAPCWVAFDRRI